MQEKTVSLLIEKFSLKGYGVGTTESGSELEVAHAVPGDELLVSWKKKRRSPQKGRLQEILSASSHRIRPSCPHAHICGGCVWQQLDYPAQLQEKQRRVQRIFQPHPVEPIVPSPSLFHYRNKMEFSFSENRAQERFFGLMIAQAEPYVFNVSECLLGPPWFNEAIDITRKWWETSGLSAYSFRNDTGSLRYLTLRSAFRTHEKMAVLNVSGNPDYALNRLQIDSFVKSMAPLPEISLFLRIHQTKKGTPTRFYEMHLQGKDHILEELTIRGKKLTFKISPSSFFQPNPIQAEKLYETALDMLEGSDLTLLDLYSGTGSLSMAVAPFVKEVISIELSNEAVCDAEENLERNQIQNVRLYAGDAGKVLKNLWETQSLPPIDAVLLDPPRAGLDPTAISHIQKINPKKIVYISCNPLTQREDVQKFLEMGYQIQKIQPVDQFPHTYHIENVVLLTC